jgi:hypothetical protein
MVTTAMGSRTVTRYSSRAIRRAAMVRHLIELGG